MTQIDELVKRARSVADHAFSGTPQFVAELADAIESQSAELTRLRDRNAELEREGDALRKAQGYLYIGKNGKTILARELEDERDALSKSLADCVAGYERDMAEDDTRIASLEATVRELREALKEAIDLRVKLYRHGDMEGDTDSWSDNRVANNDSFTRKWLLALAASESVVGKSEGEKDGE